MISENRSGGEGAPGAALSTLASGPAVEQEQISWAREIFSYVTLPFLLDGAFLAIKISALAMLGGLILGLGLALLRLSRIWIVRALAWTYIWLVRGTPQLLQLVFLYDALPGIGIKLDTFTTAVLGFALNEAAFSAEIIRGGILSVNRSQSVAAAAFGMGQLLTMRRIILPQAMRAIMPAIANEQSAMIKLNLDRVCDLRQRAHVSKPANCRPELQVLHRLHRGWHHLSHHDKRRSRLCRRHSSDITIWRSSDRHPARVSSTASPASA